MKFGKKEFSVTGCVVLLLFFLTFKRFVTRQCIFKSLHQGITLCYKVLFTTSIQKFIGSISTKSVVMAEKHC